MPPGAHDRFISDTSPLTVQGRADGFAGCETESASHFQLMATLERALQIAVQAHAGQKDKSGAAYIFHPLRVMMRCTAPEAKIVGLLHDVVEDTGVTFAQLEAEGFSPAVLAALRLVTHDDGSPYHEYVERMKPNPIAVEVKLADLEDNCDLRRLPEVDDRTVERLRRYHAAWKSLTATR